jgi:hypothetical protein
MNQLDALIEEIRSEFPDFRIVYKYDSTLMRTLDVLLRIITFGAMHSFMDDFATTIGSTVYIPSSWRRYSAVAKCLILKHERVHLRQQRKYGKILFALLYLFVFLPIGLAYFRAKFEKEAYEVSIREAYKAYGPLYVASSKYRESIISIFTGSSYAWMWPFRRNVELWYDSIISSLG